MKNLLKKAGLLAATPLLVIASQTGAFAQAGNGDMRCPIYVSYYYSGTHGKCKRTTWCPRCGYTENFWLCGAEPYYKRGTGDSGRGNAVWAYGAPRTIQKKIF